MPVPGLAEITVLRKVGGFFKRLFTSPYFYVALAFIAIGTGTFFYLKNDKADAVDQAAATATEQADTKATITTLETQGKVADAFSDIDREADQRRQQTTKDYENVRTRIIYAPADQKEAAVPPLIIDTINELDRLRALRERTAEDPVGVRDSEVPAG